MARTKQQKKEIVEKLETIMSGAKSLVFTNIHKLNVSNATAMRRQLKKDGVGFFVAKKTLTERVLKDRKYQGDQPEIVGELGLAYGMDLIAPARGVYEFQKKYKDQISIVGGVFDGKYLNKEEMLGMALVPSLQTLYGMFVNVVNSPIQGLVVALDQIGKKKTA